MPRDSVSDEIHDLLRQPLGPVAHAVAWGWLQEFRSLALAAVQTIPIPEQRDDAVAASRRELLRRLGEVLPELTRLECLCDRDISEAQSNAARPSRQRLDEEVLRVLEDSALDRATVERLVEAESRDFQERLRSTLDEEIDSIRQRFHQDVRRVLEGMPPLDR